MEALTDLLSKVREKSTALVPRLEGVYTAVGDLHGDLKTLELVLKEWPPPYLFLGDYVDRGSWGLEVITQVFQLTVEGKAVALRGNHESPLMNIDGGFLDELCRKVANCGAVFREFEKTYARLPLAAVVNQRVVAIHGGVPLRDDMTPAALSDLEKAEELRIPEDPIAFQALWNDPCLCDDYQPSPRGWGAWLFGRRVTHAFHRQHKTQILLRGHTYLPSGCATHHDGAVVTIFTSTVGPYRKTKPKIALVKSGVEVVDLTTREFVNCSNTHL